MSTKTSIKRIALVAVSALGVGLLSVVPAQAAITPATINSISGDTMVRTDDANFDDTVGGVGAAFGLTTTEGAADDFEGAKVKVTYQENSSAAAVTISTVASAGVPANAGDADTISLGTGISITYDNDTTGKNSLGTPASGVYTVAINASGAGTDTLSLDFGRNATPGFYTLYVDNGDGDFTDAADKSASIMIADMPSKVSFTNSVSGTSAGTRVGAGTLTYYVKVRDAGNRDSYLLGTERVRFGVSGGTGSGLSVTTPALPTIGATDLTSAAASRRYSLTATSTAAAGGAYTLTGTLEGFANTWTTTPGTATATITSESAVVSTAATSIGVETAGCTGGDFYWDFGVCTYDTTVGAAAVVGSLANVQANVDENYLPTSQTQITVLATFPTTAVGDAKFTVVESNISGILTGTEVLATIVRGSNYNTATYTFSANYGVADKYAVFQIATAGGVLETAAVYANPTPGYVSVSPNTSLRVAAGSTTELKATVYSIFGQKMVGQGVTFTTNGSQRNASRSIGAVTDANGVATFSITDTYTGVSLFSDAYTIATVNNGAVAGYTAISGTIYYGTKTTGSISLAVWQPSTIGVVDNYDSNITTAVAPEVWVDDTPDQVTQNLLPEEKIADQILIGMTLKDAVGAVISGQSVVVTGSAGVCFASGGLPNDNTAVADVSVDPSNCLTSRTRYSNASGVTYVQAAFTKSGPATITMKSGDITKTFTIAVNEGTARVLSVTTSGNSVTATVTDLRGNPVPGVNVSFSTDNGRFGNGVAYSTSASDTAGKVVYDVFGTGTANVSVSMPATAFTSAVADADNGLPAGKRTGSASVTMSVTSTQTAAESAAAVAAAAKAAADAAIAEAKAASEAAAAASDAALEAIDAANAATDAANLAAEAADAATVAAEEARDAADAATAAVEALAADVATLMAALKAQITTLGKTIAKIAKKVKA